MDVMGAAGCEDRVVRHWDTTTGLEVAEMTGHAGGQHLIVTTAMPSQIQ